MAKTGPKLKIDNNKLKAILPIMLQAPTPKYLAMGLGINNVDTVRNYIKTGTILQEEFSDKLEDLLTSPDDNLKDGKEGYVWISSIFTEYTYCKEYLSRNAMRPSILSEIV